MTITVYLYVDLAPRLRFADDIENTHLLKNKRNVIADVYPCKIGNCICAQLQLRCIYFIAGTMPLVLTVLFQMPSSLSGRRDHLRVTA